MVITSSGAEQARPVVVFLINSLAGGGAERVMSTLLGGSLSWTERYDLHLILLDREPDAYPLPDWLTVHRLDSRFSLLRSLRLALSLLQKLKPVAGISFLTRSNLVAIAAARLFGFKAIVSERVNPSSHHGPTLGGRFARLATRLVYPRADRIVCPSAGVAHDLAQNFAARKTTVIANPLDAARLAERAAGPAHGLPDKPFIAAMGRLVENKNFALLLAALAVARCEQHLVVLGEGPLRQQLEAQAAKLGLAERVHFLGFAENPFPVIAAAQVFVSSSDAEGFPNALAEAMALGVPVIATNCRSGPSEILDGKESLEIDKLHHGRYGMLVPPGNAPVLAAAIAAMAEETMQQRYRKAARQGVERFSTASFLQKFWLAVESEIHNSTASPEKVAGPSTSGTSASLGDYP